MSKWSLRHLMATKCLQEAPPHCCPILWPKEISQSAGRTSGTHCTQLSKLQALRSSKSALLPKPLRLLSRIFTGSVSVADPNWGTHLVQDILQLLPNSDLVEANVLQLQQIASAVISSERLRLEVSAAFSSAAWLRPFCEANTWRSKTKGRSWQHRGLMGTGIASTWKSFDMQILAGLLVLVFLPLVECRQEGEMITVLAVSSYNGFAQLRKFASCFQVCNRKVLMLKRLGLSPLADCMQPLFLNFVFMHLLI